MEKLKKIGIAVLFIGAIVITGLLDNPDDYYYPKDYILINGAR